MPRRLLQRLVRRWPTTLLLRACQYASQSVRGIVVGGREAGILEQGVTEHAEGSDVPFLCFALKSNGQEADQDRPGLVLRDERAREVDLLEDFRRVVNRRCYRLELLGNRPHWREVDRLDGTECYVLVPLGGPKFQSRHVSARLVHHWRFDRFGSQARSSRYELAVRPHIIPAAPDQTGPRSDVLADGPRDAVEKVRPSRTAAYVAPEQAQSRSRNAHPRVGAPTRLITFSHVLVCAINRLPRPRDDKPLVSVTYDDAAIRGAAPKIREGVGGCPVREDIVIDACIVRRVHAA